MAEDLTISTWTADSPLQLAAIAFMAEQSGLIQSYEADLQHTAPAEAVHEARKAMRRLRTAFKLFTPYWPSGSLRPHRQSFRQTMRHLAWVRDTDVLVHKLEAFMLEGGPGAEEEAGLESLCAYWREERTRAQMALQAHLATPQRQAAQAAFETFLRSNQAITWRPVLTVRQAAPVLLYQRLAGLERHSAQVETATVPQLHKLRIQGKDVRYTLEFLRPAGNAPHINQLLEPLKVILTHLGDLNDAHVHRRLLAEMPSPDAARDLYDAVKAAEEVRLIRSFYSLWQEIATPLWQQQVLQALEG